MDNNMMMQMMQMMMQQQQMMSQMLMAQMQPASTIEQAKPIETKIDLVSNGENQDLLAQIEALKAELAATKAELEAVKIDLAAGQQTLEATQKALDYNRESTSQQLNEFGSLKKTVKQAEAFLGQTIEELAAQGAALGGDDYYEDKKKEWNEEGLSNQEKHERVKAYRELFKEDDDLFSFE